MAIVIGIAGSPRESGNSTTLMRAILKGAASTGAATKEVYLNGLTFKGCQACDKCATKGRCVLRDDLTPIIEELNEAEGWVLASPIYYDGVTGQMKAFFDRCRTFTMDSKTNKVKAQLEGKRGGAVIVTYEDKPRKDYFHEAKKLANYLGWMGDFGKIEIISEGKLDPPDAASNRPDLLERAEEIGKDLFN